MLLVMMIVFGAINYSDVGEFNLKGFPWFLAILILLDAVGFFFNLYRLKKMGIDIALPENQDGTLSKTILVDMPKEKIKNMLKQNVWKFKTESITETEEGTLIEMKYYQILWKDKIEILITENSSANCSVKLTAGHKKKYLFMSVHSSWGGSIKHLKYFGQELSKREVLHLQVT